MSVSSGSLKKWQKRAQSAASRIKNYRAKAEKVAGAVTQTIEIGAASFGMGLVNGRWSDAGKTSVEVAGVPLDLGMGIGLHVVGFMIGGRYDDHMHNLGDGALATYLAGLGHSTGAKMLAEGSGGGALPETSSEGWGYGVSGLSDAELRRMATL